MMMMMIIIIIIIIIINGIIVIALLNYSIKNLLRQLLYCNIIIQGVDNIIIVPYIFILYKHCNGFTIT